MIKDVLIPEKLGNNYLFAKRVVGFYIDSAQVTATQLYLRGTTATVEQTFMEMITADLETPYDENVSQVIKNILEKVGKYDAVYTAIPGAQVIFKTLKLPFTTYEKIKMVVNYEVEPLLPFSLDEAVIDFIITKENTQEGSSEVIVAAVQKSVVAEQISFFEQIGVHPQKIGVDLFELYGLYSTVPAYKKLKGATALLDIGHDSTRVALMHDGQLMAVRVLPQGVKQFAVAVGKNLDIPQENAYDLLLKNGFTDQKGVDALQEALKIFWAKIQFTLSSFVSDQEQTISKFIFSGKGSKVVGLIDFFSTESSVSCEPFQVNGLFSDSSIKIKSTAKLSTEHLTSLGLVLPSVVTSYFNLLPKHMSVERDVSLLTKQIVVGGLFLIIVLSVLITNSFLQSRKLRQEIKASQEDVIELLQERFKIDQDKESFDEIVDEAEGQVRREESIWAPFTSKLQFLKYLLELHQLDVEDLGLEIEKLSIADSTMTLKARVPDFPSLTVFENELRRSKLFKYTGSIQNTDFTIKIPLARR